MDGGKEFFRGKRGGAAKSGAPAAGHEIGHATNVVIVPMGGDDQLDLLRGVNPDTFKVFNGSRNALRIDAGIDNQPIAIANVQDHAFTVSGAEQREFELGLARCFQRERYGLIERKVSCAHALLS